MLSTRDTHRLKMKEREKIFHVNVYPKKAGVAVLTSDKLGFKSKSVVRDKGGHYIRIKESTRQDITIINIRAPSIGTSKYIKQILTDRKAEIDSNTITGRDFNTPNTILDRICRQKVNKKQPTQTTRWTKRT